MKGQINGKPLMFMVDTGATLVSVSNEFASAANLTGGRPIVVATASGTRVARLIEGVSVTVSIFTVPKVNVSVGLAGLRPDEGLLGQSFLSKFEVTMDDRQMILRNKKR
jgi:aspartyl protease family protein